MSRRSVPLAVLLFLALPLVGWWALRARDDRRLVAAFPPASTRTPSDAQARELEPPAPTIAPNAGQAPPVDDAADVRLSGVVRDDTGRALDAFDLYLRPLRRDARASDVRRPVEGNFAMPDGRYAVELKPGSWMVTVVRGNAWMQREVALAQDEVLDFVLPRSAKLAGRVEDPFGRPVAGAQLCVMRDENASASGGVARSSVQTTDDQGNFELDDVPPGELALEASARGWALSTRLELELAAGQELAGTRVVLRHAARVLGRALDDEGRPDVGREVRLIGAPTCATPGPRTATADGDGHFEFVDLPPAEYELERVERREEKQAQGASLENDRSLARLRAREKVALDEGQTLEVVLGGPLERGIRVWGVVAGFERVDGPLFVNAHPEETPPNARRLFSPVDQHGGYEILLDAPGAHTLSVESKLGTLLAQRVQIADSATQRLDLELGSGSIRGRVLDAVGAPVASAEVALAGARSAADLLEADASFARRADTDEQGAFAFDALAAGTYELQARAPRGRSTGARDASATRLDNLIVEPGAQLADVELRFPLAATIEVEVASPTGAAAGIRVQVVDEQGQAPDIPSPRWTDAQGRTRVEGLQPGTWFIHASDERYACEWSAPIAIAAGAIAHARLELAPGAMLSVDVVGAREPGTWLVAQDARGFELARVWARAPDGRARERQPFAIGPVPFGRVSLLADDEHGRARKLELAIDSPRPPPVAIEL